MKLFNWNKEKKVDSSTRIRIKMAEKNIKNLRELSTKLGWNYYTLWNKVAGRRAWSLEEARDMSLFFKVPIEKLFYEE